MSGQGESHSEKVDICAYSSNSSRMGSSPPPCVACHDYQGKTKDFNMFPDDVEYAQRTAQTFNLI